MQRHDGRMGRFRCRKQRECADASFDVDDTPVGNDAGLGQ